MAEVTDAADANTTVSFTYSAAGKKPTDAESLRRLLRDALAIGDASVKLKRENETLSVMVALPE